MSEYKDKSVIFGKLFASWLEQFAEAYNGILPPTNVKVPADEYIQYNLYADDFARPFIQPISIYKQKTTSMLRPWMLAEKIGNAISEGGVYLRDDETNTVVKINKGSPFAQNKPDEDETVRAVFVNLEITVY